MQDVVLPTLRGRVTLAVFCVAFLAWGISIREILGPIAHEVTTLCYCDSLPYVRGEVLYIAYMAMAAALPSYWLAFRIFQTGQTPIPGAYVFVRTEVRRGWRAKVAALGWLIIGVAITSGCIYAWIHLHLHELLNYEAYSGCK